MTSQGKTYTNAFPLDDLKRWQSVGKALDARWVPIVSPLEVFKNPLEVLREAVEKLCANYFLSALR